MKKSVVNVINLLGTDNVYIPKAVMKRDCISEETKFMFGVIFSECLRNIADFEKSAHKAAETVRKFSENIDTEMISKECFCTYKEARKIKSELISLTATLNIEECFLECELTVADNANFPACRVCEKGKLMYMFFEYFSLSSKDILEHCDFTEDEKKLFSAVSENINQKQLSKVIDIMKNKRRKNEND